MWQLGIGNETADMLTSASQVAACGSTPTPCMGLLVSSTNYQCGSSASETRRRICQIRRATWRQRDRRQLLVWGSWSQAQNINVAARHRKRDGGYGEQKETRGRMWNEP